MTVPRLRMAAVRKSFGATQALKGVSLDAGPGEICALIGENGAGKSTLMKILSGACIPDGGSIELDGRPFRPDNPSHARRSGIAMIYQELTLAPHLSVEENILLGEEPSVFGWLKCAQRRDAARRALEQLQHEHIPLDAPVSSLTIAEQQIVEIARSLVVRPRVLIMDEPTSSLTQADKESLFRSIRKLRGQGVSVIYISHFLEECRELCDRCVVLRDGESVWSGDMKDARIEDLIRRMVGREVSDIYPRTPHEIGRPVLELKALAGVRRPCSVNLTLRAGEILGIAGLMGAGRTETLRACFGLDRVRGGVVVVGGREQTRATPLQRLAQGVGLLSENRKEEGLMLGRSLADNLTLTRFGPVSKWGFISGRRQRRATREWMETLAVRARDPDQAVQELSGGNQQKIALGRLLHHEAEIFLLDEPTLGIDVGSKQQIYRLMGRLASEGKSVVFVSSYLPELMGVCDTIGVMCRGVLSAVRPVSEWTEDGILAAAVGQGG